VKTFVIDSSIAVKWVVEEDGTENALALRRRTKLIVPELLTAEVQTFCGRKCSEVNSLKMKRSLQIAFFKRRISSFFQLARC